MNSTIATKRSRKIILKTREKKIVAYFEFWHIRGENDLEKKHFKAD